MRTDVLHMPLSSTVREAGTMKSLSSTAGRRKDLVSTTLQFFGYQALTVQRREVLGNAVYFLMRGVVRDES